MNEKKCEFRLQPLLHSGGENSAFPSSDRISDQGTSEESAKCDRISWLYCGLLSGKMTRERIANLPDDWRGRNRNFQEPLLSHNLRLVELVREIGLRHELTAGEVAIAWTLQASKKDLNFCIQVGPGDKPQGRHCLSNSAGIHGKALGVR